MEGLSTIYCCYYCDKINGKFCQIINDCVFSRDISYNLLVVGRTRLQPAKFRGTQS